MCLLSPSVPQPDVTVTVNNTGTLYAGTGLTLTCTGTLDSSVDNDEHVSIDWSRIPGGRSTVSPAMRVSDSSYTGSLTISPLADQDDDGTYTCTVTVTGGANVQLATASDAVTITVMGKYIIFVLYPAHICFIPYTALPAPEVTISESGGSRTIGQTFLLTCSVRTVPHLVVSPSIQWTRQDGRVVNSSTGSELWLSFNPLVPTDSSVYTCRASVTITDIASVSGQASEEILLTSK